MTYEECVRLLYFDPGVWGAFLIGSGIALVLKWFGRPYVAVAVALSAVILGSIWAGLSYDLRCVELYEG